MQVERHAQERIDEKWRRLEKRERKEAKDNAESFIPMADRPEATFIGALIDSFLEVHSDTFLPPELPCYVVLSSTTMSSGSM